MGEYSHSFCFVLFESFVQCGLDGKIGLTHVLHVIDWGFRDAESAKEISGWNLRFEHDLLKMQGRILPPEKILMAGSSNYTYKPEEADWSRALRNDKLISCVPLQNWLIIFTNRDQPKAQDFLQTMTRVGPPMGININRPAM